MATQTLDTMEKREKLANFALREAREKLEREERDAPSLGIFKPSSGADAAERRKRLRQELDSATDEATSASRAAHQARLAQQAVPPLGEVYEPSTSFVEARAEHLALEEKLTAGRDGVRAARLRVASLEHQVEAADDDTYIRLLASLSDAKAAVVNKSQLLTDAIPKAEVAKARFQSEKVTEAGRFSEWVAKRQAERIAALDRAVAEARTAIVQTARQNRQLEALAAEYGLPAPRIVSLPPNVYWYQGDVNNEPPYFTWRRELGLP